MRDPGRSRRRATAAAIAALASACFGREHLDRQAGPGGERCGELVDPDAAGRVGEFARRRAVAIGSRK